MKLIDYFTGSLIFVVEFKFEQMSINLIQLYSLHSLYAVQLEFGNKIVRNDYAVRKLFAAS